MSLFGKKPQSWNSYISHSKSTDISGIDERIKASLNFMGIDKNVLQQVKKAAEILAPHRSELVNHFYGAVTNVDHLKSIINNHSTVERLRKTMEKYLDQFLQAEVNEDYVKTRVIVGHVHSRIHLTADHFISAHHFLLQLMTTLIMQNMHGNPHQMIQSVMAVQKLAAFDQQLIVEVYMEETLKTFLFSVSDTVNNMTQLDTTKQLILAMEQQLDESLSVTSATEQMSASIQEVAEHSSRVADGTGDAVESAELSQRVIGQALGNIEQVGQVYGEVLEQVSQLNKEIEQTQDVVNIIREISDQTNLLALNASIEAARAGEEGRGFAIVAAEVRKLSEHTREQITQITANMESLKAASDQVNSKMIRTRAIMESGVNDAKSAGQELQMIVATMKEINQSTTQIAAMTEEQASSVADIAHRNSIIHDLSSHSQEIALETAKMIYDLSEQIDKYRLTFLNINIKMNAKDIVKIAKTDHLLWKWRVYNMLLGLTKLDVTRASSHTACRLGRWYYSELPETIKSQPVYKQLEKPHQMVHQYALEAVEQYEQGQHNEAQNTLVKLQQQSNEVIELLNKLELEL
ncbi:protoglobin domain-containing protein [Paenibacillus sp. GXUN7292]|uniref:protoglobin domain-containing protein n=1 Tax=Paenibacillus sp. GXUN7292 TaxID=3422499 RepID=UPI003D7E698B